MNNLICQSCGMPMKDDPGGGGTNADGSKSSMYCSYCFSKGRFLDEGISLDEKIEKNIQIARSMLMNEEEARRLAYKVLPSLKRWSND